MVSFDDDEENGAESGSDNNDDVDETMEDADDADADADADADGEQDDEGDDDGDEGEGDNEDDDEGDGEEGDGDGDGEGEYSHAERQQQRQPSKPPSTSMPNGAHVNGIHPSVAGLSFRPPVRPEAISAPVYDIVPTVAAPQSTSINTVAATPDMRWVFSGGSDGYIRKFNWPDTVNGKLMLTVAQRHPFVDSVVKAGVLVSYWENEDVSHAVRTPPPHGADEHVHMTPVYSLAVQHQALWLLSGGESGGINLQSVRHSEGTRITTLKKHSSAVSVLNLADDERSVLSGSWDKTVIDWDLNTGKERRVFGGSAAQISSIERRPLSTLPVPRDVAERRPQTNGTLSSNNAAKPRPNGILANGDGGPSFTADGGPKAEDADAAGDADDLGSLFGDDDDTMAATTSLALDGGNAPSMPGLDDDDDEFSRAIANGIQEEENEQEQSQQQQGDSSNANASLGGAVQPPDAGSAVAQLPPPAASREQGQEADAGDDQPMTNGISTSTSAQPNGTHLPHSSEPGSGGSSKRAEAEAEAAPDPSPTSPNIFLDAAIDGTLRIWDVRSPTPLARVLPKPASPWCMDACWSPDGNFVYAGRRNGTVDEYSLHKGFRAGAERTFKFPGGSGPVSAVKAMPNGRHLICASYDILRLYDLREQQDTRHSTVPFLIVPGHRTGVISQLFIDPTCRFLISAAGNRGWDGSSTEVLLGYEIGVGS